ncbi:hypothetical protein EV359DRAFT_66051 [Lentinula novae-zelandiae]|nr:hypothetical protein EV359DRAFT_66051 [Lentinula novae-zelandiae]
MIDSPSRPQLQLFENVFNTGKPLAGHCLDDPFWSFLAPIVLRLLTTARCYQTLLAVQTVRLRRSAVWYDANLHQHTFSTTVLLNDQDADAVDQQELRMYLAPQQEEAVVAAKHKRNHSQLPVAGPSRKKTTGLGAPKRHPRCKHLAMEAASEPAPRVQLVIPPGHSVAVPPTIFPCASPSPMEVPSRDEPLQGPVGLVQLAAAAEAQSGVVQRGTGSDPLSSNMPPTPRSSLIPCTLTAHPYCTENQRLLARVRSLEFQLADSQQENSSFTTALWDTSHTLEARQREVKQLRTSSHEVLQHEIKYRTLEEELCVVKRDRDVAVGKLSTASCKSSELMTALMQQQGLVDGTNALATHQRHCLEELQEEVHCTCDRAAFIEQMIKDHYIGAIIEAVVAFLRRGLDSANPDVIAHNFQLTLDYMQTAQGIHGDLYMRSVSSIDEGLHCLVLEHSCFDNDGPFLTTAQHAGFAAPPEGSLEPPLHHRMLVLSTAFPHHDGAGRWDDVVPAIPSLDQSTISWEQLMLEYIHHITDTPMSVPVSLDEPTSALGGGVPSSSVPPPSRVPLFLPPPSSPSLPPLFGSVANLAIDLTGDDNDLYEPEDSRRAQGSEADEMGVAAFPDVLKEEPL